MAKDPVCGMEVSAESAAAQETYRGTSWYFCCESCHDKFRADPAEYAGSETLVDPVCDMEVSKDSDYHAEYAARNYYFCSESCLDKFKKEPGQYT